MDHPSHASLLPDGALEVTEDQVAERLRSARRRGEPAWLWPEIDPAAWRAGLEKIEVAVREELAGAPRIPLHANSGDAIGVALAAFTSGTGPLLGRWWEAHALDTSEQLGSVLALHLEHGRARWQRLREIATHAIDILAEVGASPLVLKGAHTATAFFEEPGCRPLSDLDLSVSPQLWAASTAALLRAGYTPLTRQERLGKIELLPPGQGRSIHSVHLLHEDAPLRLDLHAGIDRAFFGVTGLELGATREDETEPFPMLHPAARVLREPLLTATLAAHASEGLHNLTLIRQIELARVVRAGTRSEVLDWEALTHRIGRRALRFLFPSLELVERLSPGTVPPPVRRALRAEAPPTLRRVVDALRPASTQRVDRLSLEERLMWAGSPGELIDRLGDMAWPASAGSWGDVAAIYAARFWRLARGRVGMDR